MNEVNESEKVENNLEEENDNVSTGEAEMKNEAEAEVVEEEIISLKKSVFENLEKEKNDFKEKFYYIAAEKENMMKRFEREKENLLKYGSEKILSGLLSVLDNLDLTLNAISNDEDAKVKNIFVGIEMVKHQFVDLIKSNGLQVIEAVGKNFDPNQHEALMQREEEGKEANIVLEEIQKGYILNGRVIRAAKVIISK